MKKIVAGLWRRGRWALVIFVLAVLPSCLANNNIAGPEKNGAAVSVPQQGGASLESHPYVYNRPHHVPADYIYRTERIIPAPGQPSWPLSAAAPANGSAPQPPGESAGKKYASQLVKTVHKLVGQLLQDGNNELEEDQRLLVSSFVNLNDLYKTSALGRFLGEQMISELQHAGIEVVDVRKSANLLVHQRLGEFSLSRDMEEIPYIHEAHATVVGTYSEADGQLLINARILRNSDSLVMASASVVMEENALLSSLLKDEAAPVNRQQETVKVEAQ